MTEHHYQMILTWTGNKGQGTKEYRGYERSFVLACEGKPDLVGSADPMFLGDKTKYNPEELLVAALTSCHMLSYLHQCAENKIIVTQYRDQPNGTMKI
ncbi:MAG: OsmC family protein, partial [Verrucomicrobia bacterium]|nr:OsmC family protein [Verrucomicrobiota bacterium]